MRDYELLDALGGINPEYIDSATKSKSNKKTFGFKWGVIAACFVIVTVIVVTIFQNGLSGTKTETINLDNGEKIIFVKTDTVGNILSLDMDVTTRPLTEEEINAIFVDLPIAAVAIFPSDEVAGSNRKLIGIEGKIENTKIVISTSDVQLFDKVIVGDEKSTEINGTSVTAGYFITDRNSNGEQNAIYYASFSLGDNTVYIENAGTKAESEQTKSDLAIILQKLIDNGLENLDSLKE